MNGEKPLSVQLRNKADDAIETAYTELMRPRMIAAGFNKRLTGCIVFRPSYDFNILVTGTVRAHITADADEVEVRAIVEAAAQCFGGTAPARDEMAEMATLTTRFTVDGVDVEMWGVIERYETGASK